MAKNKPSFTAFLIPKILPALPKKFSSLLTEEQINISRKFARECAHNDFGIAMANYLTGKRPALWLINSLGVKGLSVHYAARKKYIRTQLEQVIAGVDQVVMIGAGFDTLCLEYHAQYSNINFFEIDQEQTQRIKLKALGKMPKLPVKDNLKFVAADLSKQSLRAVLEQNGFDQNARSFFVVEGVMMYLQKSDVDKLLADIDGISGNESYLVFGSMSELVAEKDKRAKFADATLAARKEKYKFASNAEHIEELLAAHNFKLLDNKPYHELQRGLVNERQIEALSRQRGEHYYFARKKLVISSEL